MAPRLRRISNTFLQHYKRDLPSLERASLQARLFVEKTLADSGVDGHAITSRCKSVDSLRLKLYKKKYKKPAVQVTDKIGVRVITYYDTDVSSVVSALRSALQIKE